MARSGTRASWGSSRTRTSGGAAGYLGGWDGECELTFGRDGKPMYIPGPDDDGERILRKLRRSLGDGNYDFVHMISG